jgi:hemerythrin-like domain-containing protein
MTADQDPLALARRAGWPEELTLLLQRYPRAIWPGHVNLGQTARFWLDRHQMFRTFREALADAVGQLQNDAVPALEFRRWFAPRFGLFLQELHHHHRIEDLHYFPVFQTAEPRLARGFAVLEQDHLVIDRELAALETAGMALDQAIAAGGRDLEAPAATLASGLGRFLGSLDRHLDDEEDLIIPVILDQGERKLGIG